MRECGWPRAQRIEHLDLGRAVRHMILTAHDVRHAEIDIVDDARKQIEPAAVLAPNYGIAEQLRIEFLLAADEVVEGDQRVMVELEAPVRLAALGYRRVGRFALVDRRKPAPEQNLSAELQLFGRFI